MGASPHSVISDMQPGERVDDAVARVLEEARWRHGHAGYSGTLAEKHGWRIVAEIEDDPGEAGLLDLEQLIADAGRLHEPGDADPVGFTEEDLFTGSTVTWCNRTRQAWEDARLADGTVVRASVDLPCESCGGTGRRPLTDAERSASAARAARAKAAFARFFRGSWPALEEASEVYLDKWGPAAVVRAGRRIWVGGFCPS